MGRLTYISILLMAILCVPVGSAQNSVKNQVSFPAELIMATTNTTALLAGESLFCKFYCIDDWGKKSDISKILYVELIGNGRNSIFRHKLHVENGMAQADFFMPATLQSGKYKLIAYTSWMLEQSPSNFITVDITLINPFQPYDGKIDTLPLQNPIRKITGEKTLTMVTDKPSYSNRESVGIKIIPSATGKGNYSLSVRKTGFSADSQDAVKFEPPSAQLKRDLPEMRGEMISGTIRSKKGSPASSIAVALSMPGNPYAFKIVETDAFGKFFFILDKAPANSNVIIQVMDSNRYDFGVELDEAKKPDVSSLQFPETLTVNQNLKKAIAERTVASQIENAYYDLKKDSLLPVEVPQPFFHPLAKTYVLDDYTRFPTLKETIVEVLKELYVKKKKDNYTLHLRNFTEDAEIYGFPLVLIDGLLVQDFNELMNFGAKYIEKVSVVNEPYIYGPRTFSGVVAFTTKSQDFQSKSAGSFIKKITIDRPLQNKAYTAPDYSTGNLKRIPDYRHQLLWVPEIEISDTEKIINFYTSDVKGKFEITLEGITDDGTPISIVDYIEVK